MKVIQNVDTDEISVILSGHDRLDCNVMLKLFNEYKEVTAHTSTLFNWFTLIVGIMGIIGSLWMIISGVFRFGIITLVVSILCIYLTFIVYSLHTALFNTKEMKENIKKSIEEELHNNSES